MSDSTWIGLDVESKDDWLHKVAKTDQHPHITLAYLGKYPMQQFDYRRLTNEVMYCGIPGAGRYSPIDLTMFGIASVITLEVGVGLKRYREKLVDWLLQRGIPVNTTYEFNPHVTLSFESGYMTGSSEDFFETWDRQWFDTDRLFISHMGERVLDVKL